MHARADGTVALACMCSLRCWMAQSHPWWPRLGETAPVCVQIDDISKVDTYFARVQKVTEGFTAKLLSYFEDVIRTARERPRHLVMALRVVLNQETAWQTLHAEGAIDKNPWGVLYRDEACGRMRKSVERRMQPICLEADRVRPLPPTSPASVIWSHSLVSQSETA